MTNKEACLKSSVEKLRPAVQQHQSNAPKRNPFQATSSLAPVNLNSTSQQSQQTLQTQALFGGANIGVINIKSLVLRSIPWAETSRNASLKRRRHVILSSDEDV